MNYTVLGSYVTHVYKPKTNSYWAGGFTYDDVDMSDSFIERGVFAIGFHQEDLSDYVHEKLLLEKYLTDQHEANNSIQALKTFIELKEGDKIALKSSYSKKKDGDDVSI